MNAAKPELVVLNQMLNETKSTIRRGAAELREEIDTLLKQDSKEIAKALSKNCKTGKIQSIQFMYALARENEKAGEAAGPHKFRSIALEWANSPEWKGEIEPETSADEEEPE